MRRAECGFSQHAGLCVTGWCPGSGSITSNFRKSHDYNGRLKHFNWTWNLVPLVCCTALEALSLLMHQNPGVTGISSRISAWVNVWLSLYRRKSHFHDIIVHNFVWKSLNVTCSWKKRLKNEVECTKGSILCARSQLQKKTISVTFYKTTDFT